MSAVFWALTTASWADFKPDAPLGTTAAVKIAGAPPETKAALCAELPPVVPAASPASFSASTAWAAARFVWATETCSWSAVLSSVASI